jgi:hypothetical protein
VRRAVLVVIFLLATLPLAAQDEVETSGDVLSHGDFAVLLLRAVAGDGFQTSIPARALEECKRLGLVPPDWIADDFLTHGEFADILATVGVVYAPTDRDAPASPEFVEAMLRRKAWLMRDYLYVLYHKPGPIVSPSGFAR